MLTQRETFKAITISHNKSPKLYARLILIRTKTSFIRPCWTPRRDKHSDRYDVINNKGQLFIIWFLKGIYR